MKAGNEQASLTSQLWRRRRWIVPGLVVAALAVVASNYQISLSPPSMERDSAEFSAATTQVLFDFPDQSALLDIDRRVGPLVERAIVYARLATSPAIRGLVARRMGLEPTEIDVKGPYNPKALRILREPTAERRSEQLRGEGREYRLRFDTEPDQGVPIVQVYAQAPTLEEARKLADSAAVALQTFVARVQGTQRRKDDAAEIVVRQLGPSDGAVVNPGVDREIGVIVFMAALAAWASLVLLVSALRRLLANRTARRPAAPPPAVPAFLDLEEPSLDDPYVSSGR